MSSRNSCSYAKRIARPTLSHFLLDKAYHIVTTYVKIRRGAGVWNTESMKNFVTRSKREKPEQSKSTVEKTVENIVLLPGADFPIEIYTDERIAEFQKNNEDVIKGFSFKKLK